MINDVYVCMYRRIFWTGYFRHANNKVFRDTAVTIWVVIT